MRVMRRLAQYKAGTAVAERGACWTAPRAGVLAPGLIAATAGVIGKIVLLAALDVPHLAPTSMQPHRTQSSGLRLSPSVS